MSNCPDSYRDIEASFESKRSDLRFDKLNVTRVRDTLDIVFRSYNSGKESSD